MRQLSMVTAPGALSPALPSCFDPALGHYGRLQILPDFAGPQMS